MFYYDKSQREKPRGMEEECLHCPPDLPQPQPILPSSPAAFLSVWSLQWLFRNLFFRVSCAPSWPRK